MVSYSGTSGRCSTSSLLVTGAIFCGVAVVGGVLYYYNRTRKSAKRAKVKTLPSKPVAKESYKSHKPDVKGPSVSSKPAANNSSVAKPKFGSTSSKPVAQVSSSPSKPVAQDSPSPSKTVAHKSPSPSMSPTKVSPVHDDQVKKTDRTDVAEPSHSPMQSSGLEDGKPTVDFVLIGTAEERSPSPKTSMLSPLPSLCDCRELEQGLADDQALFNDGLRFECPVAKIKPFNFQKYAPLDLVHMQSEAANRGLSDLAREVEKPVEETLLTAFFPILHSLIYANKHASLCEALTEDYMYLHSNDQGE